MVFLPYVVGAIGLALAVAGHHPAPRPGPHGPVGRRLVWHAGRARSVRAPATLAAFVDVAVVPMDREVVLQHQTVLVRDGRITALGPVARVAVPAGALRIDGRGKFLIPGLADMHAHPFLDVILADTPVNATAPETDSAGAEARLFAWVANGVTTIRDLDFHGAYGALTLRLRARAAAGQAWIPRIYTAGQWGSVNYLQSGQTGEAVALDSIPAYVAAYKAAGFDFVKLHNESPPVVEAVLAAAHRVGIPVVGHVPPPFRVERAIALGYRSIEHPFTSYLWGGRTRPFSADTSGFGVLAAALRLANVWHCPTQSHYDIVNTTATAIPPTLLKVEQDSGVKLLLGTDNTPSIGIITAELATMVTAGLTPYQALLTGTRNAAEYFGTLEQSGTVAVGKRADLVLLPGNPLADVRYTAQPAGVMLGGRWLPRAELDRRLAAVKLPAFAPFDKAWGGVENLPVQSYWTNVVNRLGRRTDKLLRTLPGVAQQKALRLSQPWWAPRQALADSLGASTEYAAGTQRVFDLVARQLGELRAALRVDQQPAFDQMAGVWLAQRKAEGHTVVIPGVQ